ncbi:uncharacterized protein LOC127281073 [Leptopilina boulardi]|uniref:uncharacterized protein LOC127281073 n=1 Tax=Leptopilina boulardi TaxID=63433 RepID=UPI0021F50197|nr:uncharacterized protein LOC127281073 [Leptopilina boulardi]
MFVKQYNIFVSKSEGDIRNKDMELDKKWYSAPLSDGFCLGVIDGHGDPEVVDFVYKNFITYIGEENLISEEVKKTLEAINNGFIRMLEALILKFDENGKNGSEIGLSLSVAIVKLNKIFFLNFGNSKIVLGIKGSQNDWVSQTLTRENNSNNVGLLNGLNEIKNLQNLTDKEKTAISFLPNVTVINVDSRKRCLVLATSNFWSAINSTEAVKAVQTEEESRDLYLYKDNNKYIFRFERNISSILCTDALEKLSVLRKGSNDMIVTTMVFNKRNSSSTNGYNSSNLKNAKYVTMKDKSKLNNNCELNQLCPIVEDGVFKKPQPICTSRLVTKRKIEVDEESTSHHKILKT